MELSYRDRLLGRIILELMSGKRDINSIQKNLKTLRESILRKLETLSAMKIVEIIDNIIEVKDMTALICLGLELGIDARRLLKNVSWSSFEKVVGYIMVMSGYDVYRGLKFKVGEQRFEVDILALGSIYGFSIECKHWQNIPFSKLSEIACQHAERTRFLAEYINAHNPTKGSNTTKPLRIAPIIVTLSETEVNVLNGVAIISISKLRSFVQEASSAIVDLNIKTFDVNRISKII